MKSTILRIATALAGLFIATLNGNSTLRAADAAPAGRQFTVTMANMSFGKIPKDLKVGDTLTFVNQDTVPHSVTARNHSFDVRIDPKKSRRLVLKSAGKIAIYCIYHPMMSGSLTVGA